MPASRTEFVATRLAPEEARELRERAEAASRSISSEIRHALRRYLNESQTPGGASSSHDRAGGRDDCPA
jgi:hypothetical protein